ncbi:hypothetical protein AUH73_05885 [archaeon 13_1_40CM_4_53_4]|nr:MAG: hypothetical protein AUI07_04660 [archaeon 13_2_20CM_2_53_6]OLC61929.1 MAG: hypothetical protein AUH73_05885 [archaeon 13_1_40CM_4_53_4]OLE58530.1 MAG: hypothetical protein AUG17_06920 [Crenarchaeota archaeon 13_1_20CM_2_53_14]
MWANAWVLLGIIIEQHRIHDIASEPLHVWTVMALYPSWLVNSFVIAQTSLGYLISIMLAT